MELCVASQHAILGKTIDVSFAMMRTNRDSLSRKADEHVIATSKSMISWAKRT